MRRRWFPAIVLVLMSAACAKASAGGDGSGTGTGRLVVSQTMVRGYIEGYVSFIEVMKDGQKVFSARLNSEEPVSHDLAAGPHTLTFIVRPCDGSCGLLDPPAETCSVAFEVRPGETVTAHANERPAKGCSIELGS